jgi:hypothetical protein
MSATRYEDVVVIIDDDEEEEQQQVQKRQEKEEEDQDVIVVDVYDESDMKHEDRQIQETLEEITSEVRDTGHSLKPEERVRARRDMLSGIRKIMKRKSSKFYESDIRAMRDALETMTKHLVHFHE